MQEIIDFLFQQYSDYSLTHTLLELFAVFMNILSVIYAKRNSVLLYPTGLIGTGIFVYLLFITFLLELCKDQFPLNKNVECLTFDNY